MGALALEATCLATFAIAFLVGDWSFLGYLLGAMALCSAK
jgi:hypothetical protein